MTFIWNLQVAGGLTLLLVMPKSGRAVPIYYSGDSRALPSTGRIIRMAMVERVFVSCPIAARHVVCACRICRRFRSHRFGHLDPALSLVGAGGLDSWNLSL